MAFGSSGLIVPNGNFGIGVAVAVGRGVEVAVGVGGRGVDVGGAVVAVADGRAVEVGLGAIVAVTDGDDSVVLVGTASSEPTMQPLNRLAASASVPIQTSRPLTDTFTLPPRHPTPDRPFAGHAGTADSPIAGTCWTYMPMQRYTIVSAGHIAR